MGGTEIDLRGAIWFIYGGRLVEGAGFSKDAAGFNGRMNECEPWQVSCSRSDIMNEINERSVAILAAGSGSILLPVSRVVSGSRMLPEPARKMRALPTRGEL